LDARAVFSTLHPDDYDGVVASISKSALDLTVWQHEYRVKFDDGTVNWLFGHAIPEREADGSTLWHGFITDITGKKLVEMHERQLNRSVRAISRCNELIVRADDQQQMLGDLCRELALQNRIPLVWAGLVSPDAEMTMMPVAHFSETALALGAVKAAWAIEQACNHGVTVKAIQTGLIQVESTQWGDPVRALWITIERQEPHLVIAVPILQQGRVQGVFVIHSKSTVALSTIEVQLLQDLAMSVANGLNTLRIRSELERHQLKLEELVIERTHEIEMLNETLVQEKQLAISANLAKSDFLTNMSHELRTPLNAVIGLTGLLAQSPLNLRQLDYVEKIQFSAKGLRVLIDDILDLSKIEANELHVENAPFSLHDLLNSTVSLMGLSIGHKPIEPILDVPIDVPDQVFGDALRVKQILLNLISNAVKFTQAGAIVLSVRCLSLPHALQPGQVTLVFGVRDTGIGMTGEAQDRIFNNFTQADESTSRIYGGSGLGLAISQHLATLMHGHIAVQSELGQGTEFALTLPLFLDNAAYNTQADPQHKVAHAAPDHVRILIVDDHPLVRDGLTQTCHQLGWQSDAVDSGADALLALRRCDTSDLDYDVMLLDWHMPVMDGLAMLRALNQYTQIDLPAVVLMVAAAEFEEAVTASAEFNIDGVIAKPLTPSSLLKAVASALRSDTPGLVAKPEAQVLALKGLHVLVAEDNALNREVIEQVLLNAGAQVTLVCNGLLALDALQVSGAHFDAVLMDVQMPVMDGYTATRLIRGDLGLMDLPIFALTAHARPQDREASRLVGMSGHLVKPLEVPVMLDALAKLMALRAPPPSMATSSSPEDALHLPGLNLVQALKLFGGDRKIYGLLLNKFLVHHGTEVMLARQHLDAGRINETLDLLHNISGLAGSLQIPDLARLAASAESAMRNDEGDTLQALFDSLQLEMERVSASIQQFRAALV
jgi:signal transduction histidine kinase/DNA-binding response OmpR family regulator